jgi:hypothetical protein
MGHAMRLIATLSFFDEEPELLRECISRLRTIGVDVLVAVDGPYDLYPSEKQGSSFETVKAILDEADTSLGLILRNKASWVGNEVEKRNYMLEIALSIAKEGDWLLVVDSDHMWEMVEPKTRSLKDWLQATAYDVAQVGIAECALDAEQEYWYEARLLLRAKPGMRYDGSHWRVRFTDGFAVATLKAGDQASDKYVRDLTDVARVRHVVYEQPPERRERQTTYYEGRDGGGVEQ